MTGPGVQQDVGGVQPAYADQAHAIPADADAGSATHSARRCEVTSWLRWDLLFVSVKGGKGETLALVFTKEFTLLQADVMHLIG